MALRDDPLIFRQRRTERQAAIMRMNEAAQTDGILMTSISSIRDDGESEQDLSTMHTNGSVSQLLMDIVAGPASQRGNASNNRMRGSVYSQSSGSVAPNGSRFSVMEKTAQKFMWDDGSLASGVSSKFLYTCLVCVVCIHILSELLMHQQTN